MTLEAGSGQSGTGLCNCRDSKSYYSWFTGRSNLPEAGGGYYQLNEYLDAQISIYVYSAGFQLVPFTSVQNSATSQCAGANTVVSGVATGGRAMVTFRLRKGIVGYVKYSGELASLYWMIGSNKLPDFNYPFAVVNADITLGALAQCNFRQGDTFTVDLGDVYKGNMTDGNIPNNYTPRNIDLSVDCTNLDSSALEYNFQSASGSTGDFINTDLPGVGVGLLDGSGNPIGLGINNAVTVPTVGTVDNSASDFNVKLYPTKLAGQEVQPGHFSAQAIVTVSIP